LALKLEHPDLHWFFPLPRPKGATSPEKLAQALESSRWETLEEIRKDPLRPLAMDGPRTLYLAAAKTLRRQAQKRPSMSAAQVFLIGEAETLSPGDGSSDAANALLKLLEEPPPGTHLILTSGEPGRLLPTIRSRTTHLHLPPLGTEEVTEFLVRVKGVGEKDARTAALRAQGAIGRALRLLPEGDEPGSLEVVRRQAVSLLQAALAPSVSGIFRAALGFRSTGSRSLMELFECIEESRRDLAWFSSGGEGSPLTFEEESFFREVTERWPIHPSTSAEAFQAVDRGRTLAAGNVNPQLVGFNLLMELRGTLAGGAALSRTGRSNE